MKLIDWLEGRAKINKFDYRRFSRIERREEPYYADTEIMINEIRIKTIQRKKLSIKPPDTVGAMVVREGENGTPFIMMPVSDFIGMLKDFQQSIK